jgi:uncharacterized protein (DUF1499 family)
MNGASIRTVAAVAAGLAGVIALLVAWGLTVGLPGRRPANLGSRGGALAPCARTTNCVSSFAVSGPAAIAPFAATEVAPALPPGVTAEAALARLREILAARPRTRIVTTEPLYLHAEETSRWWGFVDDLELLADPTSGVVHVRSASRLGRRDFGVNRARVEALRTAMQQK